VEGEVSAMSPVLTPYSAGPSPPRKATWLVVVSHSKATKPDASRANRRRSSPVRTASSRWWRSRDSSSWAPIRATSSLDEKGLTT